MPALNSRRLDSLAIGLSLGCLAHCLLLPALLTFGSLASIGWMADEDVHRALLCLAVPTTIVALGMGCRQHQRGAVIWLGGIGMALFLAASLFEHKWGVNGSRLITLAGGLLLTAAHVVNYRLCRQSVCANTACSPLPDEQSG